MPNLLVVNSEEDFNVVIPGVEIVTAKTYLSDQRFAKLKSAKVFNLCRSYKYQTTGYYVSLLAAARGHKAIPDITTVQDTKTHSIIRVKSDELEELIQKTLINVSDSEFKLDVYFGRHFEKEYENLSYQLFQQFQAPLLRAQFLKHNNKWHLHNVDLLPSSDINTIHLEQVHGFAKDFFTTKRFITKKPAQYRYELAILVNPQEAEPPSDEGAIKKFIKAAESLGIGAWTITKEEYSHLPEYDALFIRETTNVNHHTYRFARRAMVEGMVVMDDPESILKCSNKVYLAELLEHNNIRTPKTLIVNKDNTSQVKASFQYPIILKQPDSAFSQGVKKVKDDAELEETLKRMLDKSDLIIAQEFLPTPFDWRIGVIDNQVLYACKYYMAGGHWQIINGTKDGHGRYGNVETFDLKDVPPYVLQTALKASNLIGNGLYGVDVKELDGKTYVIEVNDNPNLDSGIEDKILKNDLYLNIMKVFLKRLENIKAGKKN
jgi:glutathione synthase/RimK-type ligase-like ATP-grasp enzyme